MDLRAKIFVAGGRGLVGSAILRRLKSLGYQNLISPSHDELDLRSQASVQDFFDAERPGYVFLAAARVGGILANATYPAEFLHDNLVIQNNVIHSAYQSGVTKLVFLGSSCIYPKLAPQPIKEEYLLTGPLEPTNEWYAIAKIAGIKMCQAYRQQYGFKAISLMPTNLYGPGDNFDLRSSHVLPALIRKFHEAKAAGSKEVTIWGTGAPLREFLHVDDLANAVCHLMCQYDQAEIVNIGTGSDISIADLARLIQRVVGFSGSLAFDTTKPDGTPRKLLDVSRLTALGWRPAITLESGIRSTYEWYLENWIQPAAARH